MKINKQQRKIEVYGYEMAEGVAKLYKGYTSCTIYVPKGWEGKEVVVIRVY